MKPVVRYTGEAKFFNYYTNELEEVLTKDTVAKVKALDHPVWGADIVRTSVVLQKFSDGSFETMNTVYRPAAPLSKFVNSNDEDKAKVMERVIDKAAEEQKDVIKQVEGNEMSKHTPAAQPAPALEPPPECQTEAEKRAYAFGWWKAMEANRAAQPLTRPATREEKIVNPGVYEVPVANHYVDGGHLVYPKEQREWRGLTNNELQPIADEYRILFGGWVEDFARAIEAKLKEKNHG